MKALRSFLFKDNPPPPPGIPSKSKDSAKAFVPTPTPQEGSQPMEIVDAEAAIAEAAQQALASSPVYQMWYANMAALKTAIPDLKMRMAAALATTQGATPETIKAAHQTVVLRFGEYVQMAEDAADKALSSSLQLRQSEIDAISLDIQSLVERMNALHQELIEATQRKEELNRLHHQAELNLASETAKAKFARENLAKRAAERLDNFHSLVNGL